MKKIQPFGLAVAVLLISLTMLLLTLPGAAQNPVRRVVIKAGQNVPRKLSRTSSPKFIVPAAFRPGPRFLRTWP